MKLSELITLATVKMAQDGDVDVDVELSIGAERRIWGYLNIIDVRDCAESFTLVTE